MAAGSGGSVSRLFGRHDPGSEFRIVCLVLAIGTLAVFSRLIQADFVHFDDPQYVVYNKHVQRGFTASSVRWALTAAYECTWQPLVWLSYMLDYILYGLNAHGYHLTNLFLHLANSLLLLYVLRRMTGSLWKSAFATALFAVHPLHVESVAWIAERKGLLSTLFFMLALLAYVRYTERPSIGRYSLVALVFALGLTAKPMLVTLPFVLLLLDYWPLRRFSHQPSAISRQPGSFTVEGSRFDDERGQSSVAGGQPSGTLNSQPSTLNIPPAISHPAIQPFRSSPVTRHPSPSPVGLAVEKLPLLVIALGSSVVTYLVQQSGGAVSSFAKVSLAARLTNASVAYVTYILKTIAPANLAVFYPHSVHALSAWQAAFAGLFIACVSTLALLLARSRPYLLTGWLWYLGTLLPVSGLIQFGAHSMADRFTYIPLVGIFVVAAWGIPDLAGSLVVTRRHGDTGTRRADGWWKRGMKERGNGGAVCPEWPTPGGCIEGPSAVSSQPPTSSGPELSTLNAQLSTASAISHQPLAIPLGILAVIIILVLSTMSYHQTGYWMNSVTLFAHALEVSPENAIAHNGLGVGLADQGRTHRAIDHYRKAISLKPNALEPHFNLGLALKELGKTDEAIGEFETAVRIMPNCARAYGHLASLRFAKRDYAGAREALRLCRKHGGTPEKGLQEALRDILKEE